MLGFFSAILITWALSFVVYRVLFRFRVLDAPNHRSSHTQATVRGGGVGIIAAIVLATLAFCSAEDARSIFIILFCTICLALVSFIDDLKSLGIRVRLLCQIVAAIGAFVAIALDSSHARAMGIESITISVILLGILSTIWIVGYTNAFNFMDGVNGIAAGQAAVTGLGMAVLCMSDVEAPKNSAIILSLIVSGAALGFLPHNFPRARMFMGDVGSAPLGFLLSVLVVWLVKIRGYSVLIPLILLHLNFVLDTGITLVRRVLRGENWKEPHREHFYQRLLRSGKSHEFVTSSFLGIQVLVLAMIGLYMQSSLPLRVVLIAGVTLVWVGFFQFCEVRFRRSQSGRSIAVG